MPFTINILLGISKIINNISLADDGVNVVCLTSRMCSISLTFTFLHTSYFPYPCCTKGPVLHEFHHLPTYATLSPSIRSLKMSTLHMDCKHQQPLNTSCTPRVLETNTHPQCTDRPWATQNVTPCVV